MSSNGWSAITRVIGIAPSVSAGSHCSLKSDFAHPRLELERPERQRLEHVTVRDDPVGRDQESGTQPVARRTVDAADRERDRGPQRPEASQLVASSAANSLVSGSGSSAPFWIRRAGRSSRIDHLEGRQFQRRWRLTILQLPARRFRLLLAARQGWADDCPDRLDHRLERLPAEGAFRPLAQRLELVVGHRHVLRLTPCVWDRPSA